jgi:hypothetical protein
MSATDRIVYELAQRYLEKGNTDSDGSKNKRSGSWNNLQSFRNPYGKRPSAWLPTRLDFDSRQPTYFDGSRNFGKETFRDNGAYFNKPGNHQIYFPAATWRITLTDVNNAVDDSLDINRAGRLGLRMFCATCHTEFMTKDCDNDIVMTGTDVWNTVGGGPGMSFAEDRNHSYDHNRPNDQQVGRWTKERCECILINNQQPDKRWYR